MRETESSLQPMSEPGAGPGHTRRFCSGCGPRARGGGASAKPRPRPLQTPPLSPSSTLRPLQLRGVSIGAFCKDFNERTRDIKPGVPLRVRLRVHPDRSYDLSIGPPPSSYFLKAVAGVERGATRPGHEEVGVVSLKHLYEVALVKQQDPAVALRGTSLPQLVTALVGSARSLGLRVVPRLTAEECAEFQRQRQEQEAAAAQEEEEEGAKKK
ncbi:large ribosomal subunit protein uL11m-like isoform 1-T1 [Amazona ochrocephala]